MTRPAPPDHARRARAPLALAGAVLLVGALLTAACTSSETPKAGSPGTTATAPALPAEGQAIVNSPEYAHGAWHWKAQELGSNKVLYAHDENELNFLGSTTKLFTVGTYYDEFGQDQTIETPVYAAGTRAGDALQGDLVLVGKGDFILGGRGVLNGELQYNDPDDHVYYYAIPTVRPVEANPLAGLDKMAAEVKAKGITTIQGDVLVNDKLWDPYETKEGILTSIMVNDNLMDILVTPGAKAGDPVQMRTIPETKFFEVANEGVTSAAGGETTIASKLDKATNRVVVSGNLPLDAKQNDVAVYAPDPAAYARALFIESLRRAGVTVNAPLDKASGSLPPDSALTDQNKVASLTSPPTTIRTKLVTKISDNRGAESLLCLMAVKAGSKDCDAGMATIIARYPKANIEPGSLALYDGEGSDPASGTPDALLRWLTWVHGQPFAAPFKEGLPDANHDGKIFAKSGLSARPNIGPQPALFVAAAQAGYMKTASGKDAVVAVIATNATYPTVADGITKDLPNGVKLITVMANSS